MEHHQGNDGESESQKFLHSVLIYQEVESSSQDLFCEKRALSVKRLLY
jgi:hypothetical protein